MKAKVLKVSSDLKKEDIESIKIGARVLREGGLVSFPTETVYGLGANGLDEKAVRKIYKAKGRPADNPLILHISKLDQLEDLVEEISPEASLCMDNFWPGPLTIIFKKSDLVPEIISAGLDTVAIRMPDNPIARKLIDEANLPIAAPSANKSGRPSPTRADHVVEDLLEGVDIILDGGSCGIGLESTVLDLSEDQAMILRPGDITLEELEKVLPNIGQDKSITNANIRPKSPGQKYKHYAPKGEMILFTGDLNSIINEIKIYSKKYLSQGKKLGILCTDETRDFYNIKGAEIISLGSRKDLSSIGANLFRSLRDMDKLSIDVILAEGVGSDHLGMAIMNRMVKAAGGNIIQV